MIECKKFNEEYENKNYGILLSLNDDCLHKIFTYLNLKERIYLDSLSNRFNKIFTHILITEHLHFNLKTITDISLKNLSYFIIKYGNKMENIHVKSINVAYDYQILKLIFKYCINLKLLKLENITTIYNKFEENFNQLIELTISHSNNSNELFQSIMENCKNLQKLIIHNLTDSNIAHFIGDYNSLIHLKIIQQVNSQPLYYNLYEFLDIIGNSNLSKQLQNLSIYAVCFSSNFWLSLIKLKNLKYFYITKITSIYDEDKFLYCIGNINEIEYMHIVYDIKMSLKNILNIIDILLKREFIIKKFILETGISYIDLEKLSMNEIYIACQKNSNINFEFSSAYFEDIDYM